MKIRKKEAELRPPNFTVPAVAVTAASQRDARSRRDPDDRGSGVPHPKKERVEEEREREREGEKWAHLLRRRPPESSTSRRSRPSMGGKGGMQSASRKSTVGGKK
jgi:hypothetical protein